MQEVTYGYLDEKQNFHVTDEVLFKGNNPDIDKFKQKNNIKNIIYEKNLSPKYSYHMGGGGHGRM